MKNTKTIAAIAVAGIVVLTGALAFRSKLPFASGGAPGHSDHADEKGSKILYTCGMHPQIIQDHPGNCPICGMRLTPIRDGAGDSDGMTSSGITIDPAVVQNMGVRVAVVERAPISRVIRATGKIEYDEQKFSIVSGKVGGWIEKVYHQKTGAFVKKGEPLYEIYSPELVSAQREFLLSLNSGSETIRNAARKRLEFWDVPTGEISKLKSSGTVSRTITITAPRSGFITELQAVAGQSVMMGATLFKIADISTVWVNASIYEDEAPFVKNGMSAEVSLDYLPGKTFPGVVDYVYPFLDETTRTLTARVALQNPENELKPGMFATVKIESMVSDDAVVVPLEAVIDSGERKIAFVAMGEGKFEPRELATGAEDDKGRIQVISGLEPGEKIVVSGQFLLDSESRLREAVAKFGAAAASGHDHGAAPKGKNKLAEPSIDAGKNLKGSKGAKYTVPAKSAAPAQETSSMWPDPAKGKYVCPMEEDDYYSDSAGDCPKCGMDLVETRKLLDEIHGGHFH
ncbi:MAG: Cation efflux system protein CusB precursor [bacterium ADurb.Bin236]|nr:MAG: Cation efflux system protein CusB precursor [bacterium ADurb.Bin236]HOY62552.1 efflux RND transporter periplasmic adaptor subunit [bacterium]HPN94664.1 efflux RND transporter periplasmic adaptor subunit [bacterium]